MGTHATSRERLIKDESACLIGRPAVAAGAGSARSGRARRACAGVNIMLCACVRARARACVRACV